MKIFVLVILAATVIGGFIGGDENWLVGAVIGGVGTFATLFGLGALFHRQEQQRKKEELPPEIRAVFDRMLTPERAPPESPKRAATIGQTIDSLIEQDRADMAAGKKPVRRLIPHHAIKRAIILRAFQKDFAALSPAMQEANRSHFNEQLDGINQFDVSDLDAMIEVMKAERSDLPDLEREVRASSQIYGIVDPLF